MNRRNPLQLPTTCMKLGCIVGGLATALLSESSAAADDAKIRFQLPHCPTEMTLVAPEAFEGAVSEAKLLEAYQPFLFGETQGVFAGSSPANPEITLLIVEPSRVSEVQGIITPEQFGEVKAAMLAKNPSNAVVEANEILQDKDTAINDYNGIVQSSTNSSATMTLVLDGSTTGTNFTSLTGFKMLYANKCLVGAMLIAPKASVTRRDFEEMILHISIE